MLLICSLLVELFLVISQPGGVDGLLIEYPMTISKAPYMASVGKCDAVLLSRTYAVGSAACICRGQRPRVILTGTSWNAIQRYPYNSHTIEDIIFEKDYGYCSQSVRSDFVLFRFTPPVIYSPNVKAIGLHCSSSVPRQLAALGFHLPGRNYGFLSEAVVSVRRGEHRLLWTLNTDLPSNSVGPLISIEDTPLLFGMYSHRRGSVSYFKSLDNTSCNWIRKFIWRQ